MCSMRSGYCWGFAYSAPAGGDVVKIINLLGNEYSGSIGKSVTASKWKGRNYLKKWFKPTNPKSGPQQEIRSYMSAAVVLWHSWDSIKKKAYYWYQRYRKTNISPFNSMVGHAIAYGKEFKASPAPPSGEVVSVVDEVPAAVEGAKIILRRAGQATDYVLEYSDAAGEGATSLVPADENWDLFITKAGFTPYSVLNQTSVQVLVEHTLVVP